MRLFFTPGSPFARIVRIALLETGLDATVRPHELTRTELYSPDSAVLDLNPVGRVPTLELDDGTVLTETALILTYIDAQNAGPKLLPSDGPDRWRTMAAFGQALGLLEGVTTWLRATRLPERLRPTEIIAREATRSDRIASALEETIGQAAAYRGPMNAAQITLGTALGVAEIRLRAWDWRAGRPALGAWYDAIAARPAFKATEPPPS